MAATFATGFEYGIAPVTAGLALADGLFVAGTNTFAIETSIIRSGAYSLKCSATGAAPTNAAELQKQVGSATVMVARVYFRVEALPSTGTASIIEGQEGSSVSWCVFAVDTTGLLTCKIGAGAAQNGPTISTGVWYRLDFRYDTAGATWTCDWQVDGIGYTQATEGSHSASAGIRTLKLEVRNSGASTAVTAYFDDVLASITTGDYPFGPGRVLLAPLEGTTAHVSITTTEWQSTSDFSTFANFTGSAETVTPPLLGPPISTGTASGFRMNAVGAPAGNGRWPVAKPTNATNMNAQLVAAIVAVREASAGTNDAVIRAELSGSTTNIFASANPGWGTTWNYLAAFMNVGPGSAVWTPANVDLLNIEFDSTDATPNIWCQGIVVEVAQPDNSLLWQPRAMQTIYQL